MKKLPRISIIVPVLNEEAIIKVQLKRIIDLISADPLVSEIIIVDGGSSDKTTEIVTSFPEVKLIFSSKGRAKQMNAGAKYASAEILYFLHIDGIPPIHFDVHIVTSYLKKNKAGCFRMEFRSNHPWLKLMGWFTRFNHPSCRGGDQSLFIDCELFWQLGGYDENYLIYEDNILISKLYDHNCFTVIPEKLTTSARMYELYGVAKTQWFYLLIYFKKWRGASPHQLQDYYISSTKKS